MTHRKNTKDMKQVSKIWTSFNSLQCACFTQIKWRNRGVENLTFFFLFVFLPHQAGPGKIYKLSVQKHQVHSLMTDHKIQSDLRVNSALCW